MSVSLTARRLRRRVPTGAWQRCGTALSASWMEANDDHIALAMEVQSQHLGQHELEEEDNWLCSKCGAECRIGDDNLYTCTDPLCGLTRAKALDQSPEWRHRSEGTADPARCGMPINPTHTTRGCKNAMSVLSMIERERGQGVNDTKFPKMLCGHFVDRFACRAGLTDDLTALARFIALKRGFLEVGIDRHAAAGWIGGAFAAVPPFRRLVQRLGSRQTA